MLLVPRTTLLWGTSAPAHQQDDTLGYEPGFATVRLGGGKRGAANGSPTVGWLLCVTVGSVRVTTTSVLTN